MAKIIELIYTTSKHGKGDDETSPIRGIFELWTPDGQLVVRKDPCPEAADAWPVFVDEMLLSNYALTEK